MISSLVNHGWKMGLVESPPIGILVQVEWSSGVVEVRMFDYETYHTCIDVPFLWRITGIGKHQQETQCKQS